MATVTPMMRQYLQIKEKYKDALLFFRLGDFYEMFFDDAILASKELEITLTGRDCGLEERAPMCGVPFHSAESYINRLIEKGYKVAICEQLSDPAESKGLVERDVIRVITPGTVIEESMLEEKKNNYLASLYKNGSIVGIASVDVSTGEFNVGQITMDSTGTKLRDELARIQPKEIIVNEEIYKAREEFPGITAESSSLINCYHSWSFEYETAYRKLLRHFQVHNLQGFGCQDLHEGICAAGALLEYLTQTQKKALSHINHINAYRQETYMILDAFTRRNLELTETIRGKSKRGSLLWLLDKTDTAMGGRLLRKWIEEPLVDAEKIKERLDSVETLKNDIVLHTNLRTELKGIYDIERLVSRISYGSVNARDCVSLEQSIHGIPRIKKLLEGIGTRLLSAIHDELDPLEDVFQLLDDAIVEDPPVSVKEGSIIKEGYNEELDQLRQASSQGKEWIAKLEKEEKEKTGIRTLKIGYNKVFGYYIDVTKSYYHLVPKHYIRKQTLTNSERYITPELKEMEERILGADEKSVQLEYQLFCEIRGKLSNEIKRMQKTARALAHLDVLQSLATVASENSYVKPEITTGEKIEIIDGRHPVVEKTLADEQFVPNDTLLNQDDNRVLIITGPNMAGKSTYMRQVALITLMAHIGSFVPASKASISITDRIFTRVGASDDLSSGQSTFMVEMTEVANILHNATPRSLLILDEIGRGTSTFDGLSIAWAVIEFICDKNKIGAKTLFSTHYHQLTELEKKLPGVKNYRVSVKEHGDDIIFLHKIVRGGADRSFGVQVAKLAGIPDDVIERAKRILRDLEDADIHRQTFQDHFQEAAPAVEDSKAEKSVVKNQQLDLFQIQMHEVAECIKEIDIISTTPIEALNILYKMQQKLKSL
ncbi:MAG: DNA mismatch repair protein MutS [Clostridia bacterium]|jgi:DNA mismatch repair protein MutS